METEEMNYSRILITRMKYIGDVVLTTPIIHALRDAYPDAYIAYLGDAKAVSLLEHNPFLNEIIPFDFSRATTMYSLKMFAALYAKKFDLVIDLYSNPRSAVLSFATRAGTRIGGDSKYRGKLYTHRIRDNGVLKSAIEYHYQSLVPLGISPTYASTAIYITERERQDAAEFLRTLGVDVSKKIVTLHPGATWPNKIWLKEHFRSLIERIVERHDVNIICSPGPHDAELMRYLTQNMPPRVVALPLLPVRTLAAILSLTQVFVSNDSGPMHIGVAVGAKTIGIFGPEPIEIWFPYDRTLGHLPLFKAIECSPCRTTSCYRSGSAYLECMKLIGVDEVYAAVSERL
jgi:ADP-heptose:LPS heptosyltransferase